MSARLIAVLSLAFLMSGCNGGGPQGTQVSTDIQVDGLGEEPSTGVIDSRMCVSDTGTVFVTWADDRSGDMNIYLNWSLDGGVSWLPAPQVVKQRAPDELKTDGQTVNSQANFPEIACIGDTAYVVWEDSRDGLTESKNIYFNAIEAGNEAGTVLHPDDRLLEIESEGDGSEEAGRTDSLRPKIVAEEVGGSVNLYVGWFDNTAGAYDILVNGSNDGGVNWLSTPKRADGDANPGDAYSAHPELAIKDGNLWVTWQDRRNGENDIYVAYTNDLAFSGFIQQQRVDTGDSQGSFNSFRPKIATSGTRTYVVWHDSRNGEGNDILMNYYNGSTWLDQAAVVEQDSPGANNSVFPRIVVDGQEAHITWQDARNGGYDVYYRRVDNGSFGGDEVRIETDEPGAGNSVDPVITIDGDNVVVAWNEQRSDFENLQFGDVIYRHTTDGGESWSDELRLDSIADAGSYKLNIAVGVHNDMIMSSWIDGRLGAGNMFFQALTVGDAASPAFVEDSK